MKYSRKKRVIAASENLSRAKRKSQRKKEKELRGRVGKPFEFRKPQNT